VTQDWPDHIVFGRKALTVAGRLVAAAGREEACALLLGPRWRVDLVWPCRNIWTPAAERRRRFAIDPREQLLAQKWGRRRGWEVLGSLHSHPGGTAVPSATDRALAVPPALLVIQGVAEMACWWLPEEGPPRRLVWRMENSQVSRGTRPHAPS
jgi:[CysO sulfur-carrier protein]-S-L-cysteine hydrolase